MSIFMGALGGAGEALGQIGSTMHKAQIETDARTQESDLALQRAKALEQYKMALGEQQRVDQVQRIDTAAGQVADAKVGSKRAAVDAGIVDRASWTPEQQAAVDQAMGLERDKAMADPKTRIEASIRTGDISPKDAATLGSKDDALLYKSLWEQSKEDGRNARSDARIEAQERAADRRMQLMLAHFAKQGQGNPDREALAFLEGARKEISSEEVTLRQNYQGELKANEFDPDARAKIEAEYKPKFADVSKRRKEIQADYEAMRSRVGLPARAATSEPPPKPEAAPIPTLPKGAKKIGTSGGKAVYETPDGKRFIEK